MQAAITIPARYVDSVRLSLRGVVGDFGDDATPSALGVREHPQATTGALELSSVNDQGRAVLGYMAHDMVASLAIRIEARNQDHPFDYRAVRDLTEQMQWAVDEAIRLDPQEA